MHRIFRMPFAEVYPHYVNKVERKGRTVAELNQAIHWLTGFDSEAIAHHIADKTNFEDFFAKANLNPKVVEIKGVICGVRIEDIEDPLMQKIRYMDKLVDEIAKGRTMEKVLRQSA